MAATDGHAATDRAAARPGSACDLGQRRGAVGSSLGEVRQVMEALAARFAPDELNRVGFRLDQVFRPSVAKSFRGLGAKGVLDLGRVAAAGF